MRVSFLIMSAILDLPDLQRRVLRWTVPQYEQMAEMGVVPERAELIRGIVIEKMPQSPLHSFLTKKLYDLFLRGAHDWLIVRQEKPLWFSDSMPEPDVAVVRGVPQDFRTRHPSTAELVVEVAVSSAALDRENASLYAEAGVQEYWIVLGNEEQVEVYRKPEKGAYVETRVYGRGEIIDAVSVTGQALSLDELFT